MLNSVLSRSSRALHVKLYAFDWDDNIMHMPSTTRMYISSSFTGDITQYKDKGLCPTLPSVKGT